jgi:O-antigen/teichoic acid export membrane protein
MFSQLNKSSFFYFLARLFPAIAGLFYATVFIRILGQAAYGRYALIQAAVLFFSGVASAWLAQAILRFHSRHSKSDSGFTGLESVITHGVLLSCIVSSPLLIVFLFYYLKASVINILIAVVAAIFLTIYAVMTSVQQAVLRPKKIVLAETTRAIGYIIFPLIFIYIFHVSMVTALLGGIALGAVFATALITFDFKFRLSKKNKDRRLFKIYVSFGVKVSLWLAVSTLLNVSDRYIIKWFMNDASVGVYSAIYDVVYNSFGMMLAPVLYSAHPMIMKLWNAGKKSEALKVLRYGLWLEVIIGAVALIVLGLLAKYLVLIIIGVQDSAAVRLVVPVAAGAIAWQFAMLLHKPLEIRRDISKMFIYVVIALIVNTIGNIIFVPVYGYVASAYMTVISAVIYMLLVILDNALHGSMKN